MPDIRVVTVQTDIQAITMDWLKTPTGALDETQELATAILVALNTDAQADEGDVLPDPRSTDRRGWWGDWNVSVIWNGWPIGSKLWLLSRAKIVNSGAREGATTLRVSKYIRQCMQPFITNGFCSRVTIDSLTVDLNNGRINVIFTVYRGPKTAIRLQYQSLWSEIFPGA